MSAFQDFREQYPQYSDVDDDTLAEQLHRKYYADMDYGAFREQAGLTVQQPPTQAQKLDAKIREPKQQLSTLQDDGTSRLDAFTTDGPDTGYWENVFRRTGERATELAGQMVSPDFAVLSIAGLQDNALNILGILSLVGVSTFAALYFTVKRK